MQKVKYDWIKTLIMLLICIGIFSILFSKIEFEKIFDNLKKVKIIYLLSAMLISVFLNIGVGAYKRQRLLLYFNCNISLRESLFMMISSTPLRFIFPFKSSELVLAKYLRVTKNFPFLLGSGLLMIIDKIFNIMAVICFIPLGLIFFQTELWKKCLVWLSVVVIIFLFVKKPSGVIRKFIKKLVLKLNVRSEKLLEVFDTFSFNRKLKLSLYALIFQSSELFITYILFRALGLEVPFYVILVFVPLTVLVCNIPITISGLGTREAVFLFFYAAYGRQEQILSTGILVSFVEYIFIALIGLFTLFPFLRRLWNNDSR